MKVFKILNQILDALLLIFFILVFLLGLYSMVDSMIVFNHASDRSLLKYKPGSEESNAEKLEGNVAWLTIDDTSIDYPVMQGKDNTEYLNKDPYGEFSLSGSIFLDSNNKNDFSDPYNLVYGHHMEQKKMFGELDSFLDHSFFKKHKKGTLIVGKKQYDITIIASLRTTTEDQAIFDVRTTDVSSILKDIQSKASVNESTGNETHLIALSTCKDTDSNERTVVIGSLGKPHAITIKNSASVKGQSIQINSSIVPWLILAAAVILIITLLVIRTSRKQEDI